MPTYFDRYPSPCRRVHRPLWSASAVSRGAAPTRTPPARTCARADAGLHTALSTLAKDIIHPPPPAPPRSTHARARNHVPPVCSTTKQNELVKVEERTYEEEMEYIEQVDSTCYTIKKGCVPNMKVDGCFYVNEHLAKLMFDELKQFSGSKGVGGFLPAVKQIANVAALPGIVGRSVGLPDVHSGYGFAIGTQRPPC